MSCSVVPFTPHDKYQMEVDPWYRLERHGNFIGQNLLSTAVRWKRTHSCDVVIHNRSSPMRGERRFAIVGEVLHDNCMLSPSGSWSELNQLGIHNPLDAQMFFDLAVPDPWDRRDQIGYLEKFSNHWNTCVDNVVHLYDVLNNNRSISPEHRHYPPGLRENKIFHFRHPMTVVRSSIYSLLIFSTLR